MMRSRTQTLSLTFPLLLALLLASFGLGCVAQNKQIKLETGDIPPGKGVAFFIVALTHTSTTKLDSLYIGEDLRLQLDPNVLTRVYLDEGWYTLEIGQAGSVVRGDPAYRVNAGEIARFAVVDRYSLAEDDSTNRDVEIVPSQVIPVSREGLNELIIQSPRPISPIFP